uniref:Putative monolaris n=1 Tax=Rhipicephalus pulchellus TaxID=72859 RepID=L7M9H1_RHIPC
MMRFLIFLAASPALMTSPLIDQTAGNGLAGGSPAPTCETPSRPFYNDTSDNDLDILYIYNKNSCLCESTLIEKGRNHTFKSLFDCVSQCRTGQGSPYCIGSPVNAVNDSNTTSNLASLPDRQDQDEVDVHTDPFHYKPYEAFFYNMTSMKCENYTAYGEPNRSVDKNYFFLYDQCEDMCVGFNITTIYGNYTKN